ncbi:DNA polymerase I [Thermodesulfobacteriota bacterium]
MPDPKRFFLIDGSHNLFRAYHAIRGLSTSKGFPSNAVYGFANMLIKIVRDHEPDCVAVAFDLKGPTFREEIYPEYKANRPPTPDDLVVQIPKIKEMLEAFRIPVLELAGYEADDIIGTLTDRAEGEGMEVTIVTGDKDMCQLVSGSVRILDTMKDKVSGPEEVRARFGVGPESVVDILGLMGDSVDNIPGVPGVGEKTAKKLIAEYGSIEKLLDSLGTLPGGKLRERLEEHRDMAFLSKKLATIDRAVPIEVSMDDLARKAPDRERLAAIFRELEFRRLQADFDTEKKALSYDDYHLLTDLGELDALISRIREAGRVSVDLETTSVDSMIAEIVGISLAIVEHEAFYVPVDHRYLGVPAQPKLDEVLARLGPVLEDAAIEKVGQNAKYEYVIFRRYGIEMRGLSCDTMVASYLLDPSGSHKLDVICKEHLGHTMIAYKDVAGTGRNQVTFDQVDVERAMTYSCEDADVTNILATLLTGMLAEENLAELFRDIEIPLVGVLGRMEMNGVKLDTGVFDGLASSFQVELNRLVGEIHESAGEEFNVNSTQQLGKILFDKLGLPGAKRTKTGWSTNVSVLEKLAGEHELPRLVLEYRSGMKLMSTYIGALPKLINPATGRVHTSYNQAVTATGRLSSSNPNLQNIPIRTDEGRAIRRGFVPEPGNRMISADYSQIELRILADVAGDSSLIEAFRNGDDVHARTASEIFGVAPEGVTAEMRRRAKVINFGVIYGMGAFGLARQLGTSMAEAKDYIDSYFETYSGVRAYQEETVEEARKKGFVMTKMGRRRKLPEIDSPDHNMKAFAERTAINTPIQGTAADLIKIAMIRIDGLLAEKFPKAKMILQVHDELVFEVPEDEVDPVSEVVRAEMEGALELSVPLVVDLNDGANWEEIH